MTGTRPRIDLVSPLPPVRSGIADYTADLLGALAERADIRLIALDGARLDGASARGLSVAPPAEVGRDGRLPLYQMGNNRHHEAVYDLAMATPGVLVLHDLVLHHLLIGRTAAAGDPEAYRRALDAEHGWIGDRAALPLRWPGGQSDAAQFALPANRRLLRCQRGVLTHSAWARDVLLEEHPDLAVRAIPMGIPLPPRLPDEDGRAFRRAHGIPRGAPLLGSFGFQTPIKRTASVLAALAAPALADVCLLIGGEIAPASRLEALADEWGVAERVRFLGYMPFDVLQSAIAAVDLCLNLRYPTAGETSASLLRILALGRPAVVSDYAQSADLPDEVVVKVPVGDGEVDALVARLADLLADRPRLRIMGEAARAHVTERHRLADAADGVVAACRAWRDRPPPADRPARPPGPTSLIRTPLAGRLEVREADAEWPPGTRRRFEVELINDSDGVWLAGERGAGGIAIEVRLESDGVDHLAGVPWLGLPVDLRPGEGQRFTFTTRRPLTPIDLRIEPHVFARQGFSQLGGPVWTRHYP